jgi:hypothetical protein
VQFTAALLARTGCATQDPHADGVHPHEQATLTDDDAGVADPLLPPHAVQLFLPLCEMSTETGPTEFWPTSHVAAHRPFASLLPPLVLEARPGDAIAFDFRVVHRGTANRCGRPHLSTLTLSLTSYPHASRTPTLTLAAHHPTGRGDGGQSSTRRARATGSTTTSTSHRSRCERPPHATAATPPPLRGSMRGSASPAAAPDSTRGCRRLQTSASRRARR